ncbi:hypothetical protein DMB66_23175 [Actinoplanes sp. ATCC 53533]|nr:hypothetical protein DMB66_23175 [Actinoplanes sp. ATCC 53533]
MTYVRSVVDQLRMHASSPMAIFSTLAMPCVFGFIIHSNATAGGKDVGLMSDLAVGSAGIGMLDSIIVLVVFSLMGEKQWKTLQAALGSPQGLTPVILGRLSGIALQSLTALPGTLILLVVLWGVDDSFDWGRWAVGGVLLAFATAAVAGLLAVVILRFPFSSGMTNGLTGLVLAISALLVPRSALPSGLREISLFLPQAHVMGWVRGGSWNELAVAVALTAIYGGIVAALIRRVEFVARRRALPLEV